MDFHIYVRLQWDKISCHFYVCIYIHRYIYIYIHTYSISPNSMATLRGSYGNRKGPVLNRGPCAFRLHRLAQNACREISIWHFPCKFPHEMHLLTCPCAFRLRRLALNETSHTEILPRGLLSGACTEILPRDLL